MAESHTYRFFTMAIDRHINFEAAPTDPTADVVVTAAYAVPIELEAVTFEVQHGATQRSFINHIDVGFSTSEGLQAVISSLDDVDPLNDRVRLRRFNLDGSGPGELVPLAGHAQIVDRVFELDFDAQGIGGNRNSTQGDGYYALEFDLDGNGTFETTRHFYRLFGDVNGDRIVDNLDFSAILSALGSVGDGLDEDLNGDGVVNAQDRLLAIRSRGRNVGAGLHLDD